MTVLWALLGLNLAVFLATLLNPRLVALGGLIPALAFSRPWTLLTSIFLHAGVAHVAANMVSLYFFGRSLAELAGERLLLVVYFAGGLLGSAFYILLAPSLSIAVGASGAVFALGGALVALRPRLRVIVFPIPAPVPLWAAVIGGFFILSFVPNVAWQAHLGGLVAGLLAGYVFRMARRR